MISPWVHRAHLELKFSFPFSWIQARPTELPSSAHHQASHCREGPHREQPQPFQICFLESPFVVQGLRLQTQLPQDQEFSLSLSPPHACSQGGDLHWGLSQCLRIE